MQKKIAKYYVILVGLTILFSIYYYGIQLTITPDHEELASLRIAYSAYQNGNFPSIWHTLLVFMSYLLMPIFGLSYKTMRMANTVLYAIYVFFSLDIILRGKDRDIYWKRIPLYMLFMVFLPIQITEHWGKLGTGWFQYPMNQHSECMLCAIVGLWLIHRLSVTEKANRKILLLVALILWNCFSLRMTNQIWIVAFLLPELLCGIRYVVRKYNVKNAITIMGVIGCIGVAGLKILSMRIESIRTFFRFAGEQSAFFKSSDWSSLSSLPEHVGNYVTAIAAMFGCDFSVLNIYNITILLYLIKLLLVGYMFYLVACSLRKAANSLDWCIGVGIVVLSVFWIFTDYADTISHHIRYLMLILPYGTILLCLHIDDLESRLHITDKKSKIAVNVAICAVLLALFPYGIWGMEKEDQFDREYREVLETIEEKSLHTGIWIQSYGLSTQIYVRSGGKYTLSRAKLSDDYTRLIMNASEDTIYDYIVFEKNGNDGVLSYLTELDYVYAYANGEPDEIVELCDGEVVVYIYRDGVIFYPE